MFEHALQGAAPPAEGSNPGAAHPGYSAMQPHQQRVVDEKAELDIRWKKLGAFFGSTIFADLDEEERSRLRQQFNYMTGYSAILGERIDAFTAAAERTLSDDPLADDSVDYDKP